MLSTKAIDLSTVSTNIFNFILINFGSELSAGGSFLFYLANIGIFEDSLKCGGMIVYTVFSYILSVLFLIVTETSPTFLSSSET
jgi:hypothetical protein